MSDNVSYELDLVCILGYPDVSSLEDGPVRKVTDSFRGEARAEGVHSRPRASRQNLGRFRR